MSSPTESQSTTPPQLEITLGAGLTRPQGRRLAAELTALALAALLASHAGPEAWWSPHLWHGDYRRAEAWEKCSAIAVDLDYHAPKLGHSPPPPEVAARVAEVLPRLPGTLVHVTPRGVRVVYLLLAPIVDADLYRGAATRAGAELERALSEAGLLGEVAGRGVTRPGLVVDRGALCDLARLLWGPRADLTSAGEIAPRNAEVVLLTGGRLYDGEELAARAPTENRSRRPSKEQPDAPSVGSTTGPMARLREALLASPMAREYRGRGVALLCPMHGDHVPSAIVYDVTGDLWCSACGRRWDLPEWLGSPQGRGLVGDELATEILASGAESSPDAPAAKNARPPPASARAAEAVLALCALAHTADERAWARLPPDLGGHAAEVRSRTIRRLIQGSYYEAAGRTLSSDALTETLDLLEARALYDGPEVIVNTRVAGIGDSIYVDLAIPRDPRVAHMTAAGWEIVPMPDGLWMARPSGMLPLPVPERGGSLAELRVLHPALADDSRWALIGGWVVSAWRPAGGYAILLVRGEQGSGKTALAVMLLGLLDPREADVRRPPENGRDVIAAANRARLLAVDNLSYIPEWLADDLCRLATGAALTTRDLYTTADEFVVRARLPVLLTAIPDVVSARPDLRDRALDVALPQMDDDARVDDAELAGRLESARPRIVGALLDAVALGLLRRSAVRLSAQTRMLDHLRWAVACGPALGLSEEQIVEAHVADRQSGARAAVDDSTVGQLLGAVIRQPWTGTAETLRAAIALHASDTQRRDPAWPRSPRAMRATLDRLAPALRRLGWGVVLPGGGQHRERLIALTPPTHRPDRPDRPNDRDDRGMGDPGDLGGVPGGSATRQSGDLQWVAARMRAARADPGDEEVPS